MVVVSTLAQLNDGDIPDQGYFDSILNIQTYCLDTHIRPNGKKRIYVYIHNTDGVRNVYLYLRGLASDMAIVAHYHDHNHGGNTGTTSNASGTGANGPHTHQVFSDTTGVNSATAITNGTTVPKAVQIWIDGTEYTATIGDPNAKGATMYDSVNADWGTNGTTEWNTGKLNLSSLISWTAGEHYIEFRDTENTGGRLIANVMVNAGYGP
jgi:hypothetical protein